jgi:DNA-binding response OmpR family regulator
MPLSGWFINFMSLKQALVIDDDRSARNIWELVLTERGYDVFFAATLADGYEHVSNDVSFYVLDYHLPDGPGSQIVAEIRERCPNSLITAISIDDSSEVIREVMESGANIFMVKPTSPSLMTALLNEVDDGELKASDHQVITRNGRREYIS